jgi:hypothetical protein
MLNCKLVSIATLNNTGRTGARLSCGSLLRVNPAIIAMEIFSSTEFGLLNGPALLRVLDHPCVSPAIHDWNENFNLSFFSFHTKQKPGSDTSGLLEGFIQ